MSLFADPVFWFCFVMLILALVMVGTLHFATRMGDEDAHREAPLPEVLTLCHYCNQGFHPEQSDAPAHFKYQFCKKICYQRYQAENSWRLTHGRR